MGKIGKEQSVNAESDHFIRVMLADPHPVVVKGLKSLLKTYPDIRVVGCVTNEKYFFKALERREVDTLVLDFSLFTKDPQRLTRRILSARPEMRILIFTMENDRRVPIFFFQAGVSGYLLKTARPTEIIRAIRTVSSECGDIYLDPSFATSILRDYLNRENKEGPDVETLTRREKEILSLLAHGKRNREIGDALRVSVRTVESHRIHISRKLGITSSAALARYAIEKDFAFDLKSVFASRSLFNARPESLEPEPEIEVDHWLRDDLREYLEKLKSGGEEHG